MDARFKNFQLERKRECVTAEYLWRTTVNLDILLKEFQDINTNLRKYEFILIDKYNEYKFMKIRKNLNQIYMCK